MKIKYTTRFLLASTVCIFLTNCTSTTKQTQQNTEKTPFFSVNISDIKDEIELPISKLVETLDIIPLENKDEAFSKVNVIYASDNYIGIQPINQDAFKLFDKKGKFIGNIGAVGQGPGEYNALYHCQIDENNKRIFMTTYNAEKILTYNFDGKYLENENIPYPNKIRKAISYVDKNNKQVTVLALPFKGMDENVCWVQDFDGKIIKKISAENFVLAPDFSNEIISNRNTIDYDLQLLKFYQEKQDTLYRYDIENNFLQPIFSFAASTKAGELIYSYTEIPFYYLTFIKTIKMGATPDSDIAKTELIITDKKTQKSHYAHIINDYLGGWEFDPFFLSFRIRNGYFAYAFEPIELKELLEESLKRDDLQPYVRKRITELNAKLNPNDNNVIMVGKLKQ